jgi:hypothetical protein
MLMVTTGENAEDIENIRQYYHRHFQKHRSNGGKGVIEFESPLPLTKTHIGNAKVFANRYEMIRALTGPDRSRRSRWGCAPAPCQCRRHEPAPRRRRALISSKSGLSVAAQAPR